MGIYVFLLLTLYHLYSWRSNLIDVLLLGEIICWMSINHNIIVLFHMEIQTRPIVATLLKSWFKFSYCYHWSFLLMKYVYLFVVILDLSFTGRDPFARVPLFHSIKERGISLFLNNLFNRLPLSPQILIITNKSVRVNWNLTRISINTRLILMSTLICINTRKLWKCLMIWLWSSLHLLR